MTPRRSCVRLDNDGDVLLAGPAIRAVAARRRSGDAAVRPARAAGRGAAARRRRGARAGAPVDRPRARARSTRADVDALVGALAALALDRGADLHLVPPEPAADGVAAAARRRAVDRRESAWTTPARCSTCGSPRPRRRARGRARRSRSPPRAGFALPPRRRRRGSRSAARPRLQLPGALRRRPPGRLRPGPGVGAGAQRATLVRGAGAPRAATSSSPARRRSATLTAFVAGATRRSTWAGDVAGRAGRGARAAPTRVVVGNTGPAHLAAAVGTPVVSLFAPTVPAVPLAPWGVPHELLLVDVPCAGCRARVCPVPATRAWRACTSTTSSPRVERLAAGRRWRWPHEDPALARARLVDDGLRPGRPRVPGAGAARPRARRRGRARTWDWPDSVDRAAARGAARSATSTSWCCSARTSSSTSRRVDRPPPGRDVPAIYVEHNAPQGRIADMRHPVADRDDLTLVHVTHFNALFWDAGARRRA